MIKSYFKIAWRNLLKNKVNSFINIAGLSVGLTCSILIALWVQSELDIDAFHANGSRLYQVYSREYNDHSISGSYETPGTMAVELKKSLPGVEYAVNMDENNEKITFRTPQKALKLEGTFASADFFQMFSYPLLEGTPQAALSSSVSIAISRKMAVLFFGSPQAAMGKTISYAGKKDLSVTAVFEDLAQNTSRKFEYIINWDTYLAENSWADRLDNSGPFTYVLLNPEAKAATINHELLTFLDRLRGNKNKTYRVENGLQLYSEVYLHAHFTNGVIDGGRIEYVNLFSIVAIFVVLIACVNFMNLATAQSVRRAREIGIRKVMGANRHALIGQFIGESLLLTFFAVILSLLLANVLLPVFNQVTQKQLSLPYNQLSSWIKLCVLALATGFIAGSYPALFLSSFNPVTVLKGTLKTGTGVVWLRKGLVVFQFSLSALLIIGAILVSTQVNYIHNKNIGYDRDNLVYIQTEGTLASKAAVFENEAAQLPGVLAVTASSDPPDNLDAGTSTVNWEGKAPGNVVSFNNAAVGYHFAAALKLKMLAGREFSKDFPTDSAAYIINQTTQQILGYAHPIGRTLTMWGRKGTIIGLVKDFHFASLHEKINPLILRLRTNFNNGDYLLARIAPGKTAEALAGLQKLCIGLNPGFPFTYNFADEEYEKLYRSEEIVGKLSNAFAVMAILISCLGLLGLAMFTAERRVKEVSIRKVLGASMASLFVLLSFEFVSLVIISVLIAAPVAWYAINKWLESFAYHAPIQWWPFALSAGLIVLIALATVSFQTLRTVLVNPIKSLRSE